MQRFGGFVIVLSFALLWSGVAPHGARAQETVPVRITILYDNVLYADDLTADWGFSALIEIGGHTVLFDTGGNGNILLSNMEALDVAPTTIDTLVLSHFHGDHIGGVAAVLAAGAKPETVFILSSFPGRYLRAGQTDAEVIEVEPGMEIVPGIFTTGLLDTGPVDEQALVIDTAEGLVVVTGCAHPGVLEIVNAVQELSARPIYLLMGGFHLLNMTANQVNAILAELEELGVTHAGPSHCTGGEAILQFADFYGDNFVPLGVGRVLEFDPVAPEVDPDADAGVG